MKLQREGQTYELTEDEKEWKADKLPASKGHIILVVVFLILAVLVSYVFITLAAVWILYVYVFPKRHYTFLKSEFQVQQDGKNILFVSKRKKFTFKALST